MSDFDLIDAHTTAILDNTGTRTLIEAELKARGCTEEQLNRWRHEIKDRTPCHRTPNRAQQ